MTVHNPTKAPDVLIATMPQALHNGVIPIPIIRASHQHPLDAGMDLPQGWVGLIRLRSSSNHLLLLAGVVDPDDTGEVFSRFKTWHQSA